MATFEDQYFGHYREVAFIEELFCTQTVYLGPGCSAIIERQAFHQKGHYREIPLYAMAVYCSLSFCPYTVGATAVSSNTECTPTDIMQGEFQTITGKALFTYLSVSCSCTNSGPAKTIKAEV